MTIHEKSITGPNDIDQNNEAAIAEFIRTRGVTRCPTACVLPTQGAITAHDRAALDEYAEARDQLRRARAARKSAFGPSFLHWASR